MSQIVERLKSNPFLSVDKSNHHCPICKGDLYATSSWSVMDGNTVYYCELDEQHKFWRNAREKHDVLHLNKNASETNFDSEQDYKWNGDTWSTN